MTNLERIQIEAPGTIADDVKCLMLLRAEFHMPFQVIDAAEGNIHGLEYLRESARQYVARGVITAEEINRESDTDNWGRFLAARYMAPAPPEENLISALRGMQPCMERQGWPL